MKNKILIVNTGGTFNKYYNPLTGELEVDKEGTTLRSLAEKWMHTFEMVNIIGKDSLEMTNHDRLELLATLHQSVYQKIIIIHGTDTMALSAEYIADAEVEKQIVFTGAMVPFSIDPVEATANFASAFGYLLSAEKNGVFIAMNGIVATYEQIRKEKKKGKFVFV